MHKWLVLLCMSILAHMCIFSWQLGVRQTRFAACMHWEGNGKLRMNQTKHEAVNRGTCMHVQMHRTNILPSAPHYSWPFGWSCRLLYIYLPILFSFLQCFGRTQREKLDLASSCAKKSEIICERLTYVVKGVNQSKSQYLRRDPVGAKW